MERLGAFAILLAVVLATGGEDIVAEDALESPVTPGAETTELASSLKEPRLFPFGDTWLMVAAESAGERGPYGQLPCALDLRQIGKGASTRIGERVRIVLPSAAAIPPPYALKLRSDVLSVVHGSTSSATTPMIFGQVTLKKSDKTMELNTAERAKLFKDAKELSYVESVCPSSLSFLRGSAGGDQVAVCGLVGYRVTLLVRSKSAAEPSRWDMIQQIAPDSGSSPRGAWLAKDKIMVGWITRPAYVKDRCVMLGVVSRSGTTPKGTWRLLERRRVHSGPVCRVSMVPTKNGVLLGILELTSGAPRVVVYEGKDKLDTLRVSGAMPVVVSGTPVDFSINNSATKVAGIVSKGPRAGYALFVQPLKLGAYKPLDEKEIAALGEKLERESRERAKAEEEAKKSAPKTLQERLQQNE